MDIKRFDKSFEDTWDKLVPDMNNGTLFHLRKFFKYHPDDRFKDHSLVFMKGGRVRALFPAAEVKSDNRKRLVSHPGSSFGSFVVPENLSFKESDELVSQLLSHCRKKKFNEVQITGPPLLYYRRPSNYIDFSLMKKGFRYKTREITSVLFLEDSIDDILAKFRPSHLRAVRKAEKMGVEVRQSQDYESFYSILKKNLKIRHNVQPTHTLQELAHLRELFPDDIQLWGAFVDNKMVAGVVNFICNSRAILAFYISHDETYQDFRPVNILFYKIFDWATMKNYQVFDFGIFTVKEKPNHGLGRFKENFGASGIFRDTVGIDL